MARFARFKKLSLELPLASRLLYSHGRCVLTVALVPSIEMTLDVLHFIDNKGGNAEEIRESQRKRGLSVELVDEVIEMYTDWVKRKSHLRHRPRCFVD